jgi:hypothetical protein
MEDFMFTSLRRFPRAMVWALVTLVLPSVAVAQDEPSFEVYGFAMADYVQDFRRVNPAWDDTLRPSRIPTDEGQFGADGQAIISVRQSRFGVQGAAPVAKRPVYAKFEFDLFGVGVDEGQTTIRLRHAFGEWGQLLAGQTHSLFMDIDVFPNVIDYWGPTGMVFLRTPQIRWTPVEREGFAFAVAIEKPSNDIDPGQIRQVSPDLGARIQGDEKVPDLTAQARTEGDWGHIALGGIARRIGYETLETPEQRPKDFAVGWGANLGTSFRMWKRHKLILAGVYGEGIASYMNDGGVDLAPGGDVRNVEGEAVPLFGVTAYYDLYWTEQWSSTFGYSRTQVENTEFQTSDAYFRGEYASVNLLYAPNSAFLIGGEFLWGQRTDNDGDKGVDIRSQVSVKYSFSSAL